MSDSTLRCGAFRIVAIGLMAIALSAAAEPMHTKETILPIDSLDNFQHDDRVYMTSDPAAHRFQEFFINFQQAVTAGEVNQIYAKEAYLNDSLKEVVGAEAIDAYFQKTLANTKLVRISFVDAVKSDKNYYFRWVMDVQAPKLNNGEVIRSRGMSHILFDAEHRVTMHRDYWDAASGLYEHVPVIGAMVRWLKKRL